MTALLITILLACGNPYAEDCDEIEAFAYDAGVYAADNCMAFEDVHAGCFGDDDYVDVCTTCFRDGYDQGWADTMAVQEEDTGVDTGEWCGQ